MRRLALFLSLLFISSLAYAAEPPAQPENGPGGKDTIKGELIKKAVGDPNIPVIAYYIASEEIKPRSVVIFLHPWGAVNPKIYGGWIDHLARHGHLVLWPRHQDLWRSGGAQSTERTVTALKAALDELGKDPSLPIDMKKSVVVGHLAGAVVAINLAAVAQKEGLPVPKIVFAAVPGGLANDAKARGVPLEDLSQIPPSTLVMALVGDREHQPSERTARRLFKATSHLAPANRLFLRVPSDDHGYPPHTSTLTAPAGVNEDYDLTRITFPPVPPLPKGQKPARTVRAIDVNLTGEQHQIVQQLEHARIDLLDYWGFWKTLDLAMEHVFKGDDAAQLRSDPRLSDMGRWSNGWPVKRITIEAAREIAPPAPVTAPPASASQKQPFASGKPRPTHSR